MFDFHGSFLLRPMISSGDAQKKADGFNLKSEGKNFLVALLLPPPSQHSLCFDWEMLHWRGEKILPDDWREKGPSYFVTDFNQTSLWLPGSDSHTYTSSQEGEQDSLVSFTNAPSPCLKAPIYASYFECKRWDGTASLPCL